MFFMSSELKKIMTMLASLEREELSQIAQKIAQSWSRDRVRIANGFSNWDRDWDRDRDLNFW